MTRPYHRICKVYYDGATSGLHRCSNAMGSIYASYKRYYVVQRSSERIAADARRAVLPTPMAQVRQWQIRLGEFRKDFGTA